ncbi:MAG: carbonic anhydrase family protein [SAR324 cluster bacterium]|nr:carbonic anhydrase family protein [SAR324 cluster bacterium]
MKGWIPLFLGLVLATASCSHHAHWAYEGAEGPSSWGDLDAGYATCKSGQAQSPINITGAKSATLPTLAIDYKDSAVKVVNNGHTIKASYDKGSSLTIDGQTFNLLQFHFHAPSENNINGKAFATEIHFVHADAKGNLAVLAVMVKEGAKNAELEKVFAAMPKVAGKTMKGDGMINGNNLLPTNKAYYHFTGSLTTPPCSEGVSWNVLQTPITASADQIKSFTDLYSGNNRPVMPLNGRDITKD